MRTGIKVPDGTVTVRAAGSLGSRGSDVSRGWRTIRGGSDVSSGGGGGGGGVGRNTGGFGPSLRAVVGADGCGGLAGADGVEGDGAVATRGWAGFTGSALFRGAD